MSQCSCGGVCLCVCGCECVCVDAHATVCMWSSEKNFSESLLTFQHMDLEDQTQVIGLGGEPLSTEWFLPTKTDF